MKKKKLKKMLQGMTRRFDTLQVRLLKLESEVFAMRITPIQPILPVEPVRSHPGRCDVCKLSNAASTSHMCNKYACPKQVTPNTTTTGSKTI